jgi:hypothetical protein
MTVRQFAAPFANSLPGQATSKSAQKLKMAVMQLQKRDGIVPNLS